MKRYEMGAKTVGVEMGIGAICRFCSLSGYRFHRFISKTDTLLVRIQVLNDNRRVAAGVFDEE